MSDKIIRVKADNGFSGELKVGKYMAIYKNGREVLSTSEPAPKTKAELEKVLEGMTDFMDEYAGLMAQIKKATLKDAEVGEALMEDEVLRCEDCKWYTPADETYGTCYAYKGVYGKIKPTDYCSYGEREDK